MKYDWVEIGPGVVPSEKDWAALDRRIAQQNGNASPAGYSDYYRQAISNYEQRSNPIVVTGRCIVAPLMTAADLGIVDQNLDDKVGMEL